MPINKGLIINYVIKRINIVSDQIYTPNDPIYHGCMEAVERLCQPPPTLPMLISPLQDIIDTRIRRRNMWRFSPTPALSRHMWSQSLKVRA
jgi:hypothetical protein